MNMHVQAQWMNQLLCPFASSVLHSHACGLYLSGRVTYASMTITFHFHDHVSSISYLHISKHKITTLFRIKWSMKKVKVSCRCHDLFKIIICDYLISIMQIEHQLPIFRKEIHIRYWYCVLVWEKNEFANSYQSQIVLLFI